MSTKPLPPIFEGKDKINKRVQLYLDGKHALLTNALQQVDSSRVETKWVWYSKEIIQMWLEEIEDLEADGMRIYIGEKEVEEGDELNTANQIAKSSGQLCLAMVLTRAGGYTGSHINIDYEAEPDFEDRKTLYESRKSNDKERQFNFGGYCPPMSVTEGSDYPFVSIP